MSKIVTLAAGAIGFVLGSRAGREPYEKLAERAGQARRDPRVQQKVGEAQRVAQDKVKQAASTVSEKVGDDAVAGSGSNDSSATIGQSGAGPQGRLP